MSEIIDVPVIDEKEVKSFKKRKKKKKVMLSTTPTKIPDVKPPIDIDSSFDDFIDLSLSESDQIKQAKYKVLRSADQEGIGNTKLKSPLDRTHELTWCTRQNIPYYKDRGRQVARRNQISNIEYVDAHAESATGDKSDNALVQFGSLIAMIVLKTVAKGEREAYAEQSRRVANSYETKFNNGDMSVTDQKDNDKFFKDISDFEV